MKSHDSHLSYRAADNATVKHGRGLGLREKDDGTDEEVRETKKWVQVWDFSLKGTLALLSQYYYFKVPHR